MLLIPLVHFVIATFLSAMCTLTIDRNRPQQTATLQLKYASVTVYREAGLRGGSLVVVVVVVVVVVLRTGDNDRAVTGGARVRLVGRRAVIRRQCTLTLIIGPTTT